MDLKLLTLYSLIILTNIIVNANFYFSSRKKEEYLWSLNFWICFLLNFATQAVFDKHHTLLGLSVIFMSFSYFFSLNIFSKLAFIKFDSKKYLSIFGGFFLTGLILSFFKSFETFTLFLVAPATVSFIYFAYSNWSVLKKQTGLYKMAFIIYSLSLVHTLDYPFLRLDPQFTDTGFLIAFIFVIFFSMSIHFLSDSIYIKQIEAELHKKNEQAKILFQQGIVSELFHTFSHETNNSLQSIEMANSLIKIKADVLGSKVFNDYSKVIDENLEKISKTLSLVSDTENFEEEFLDDILEESLSFVKNKQHHISVAKTFLTVKTSKRQFTQFIVNILSKVKMDEPVGFYVKQDKLIIEKITNFNDQDFYFSKLLSTQLNLGFNVSQNTIEIDIHSIIKSEAAA